MAKRIDDKALGNLATEVALLKRLQGDTAERLRRISCELQEKELKLNEALNAPAVA
jgi:hypothetical protein